MLLASVATTRWLELDWLYRGAGRFFPEAWVRFRDYVGATEYRLPTDAEPPIAGLLSAYARLMEDSDPDVRARAAAEWLTWEDAVISMESNGNPGQYSAQADDDQVAFVRICSYYFANGGFIDDDVLIREAGRLAGIPGVLVHGRSDISGPAITPWELASAWPGAELIVVDDSGHTGSATMGAQMRAAASMLYTAISGQLRQSPAE
jgi:proline iminopeptidase